MCALVEHSDPGDLPRFLTQRAVSEDGNQVGPTIRQVLEYYFQLMLYNILIRFLVMTECRVTMLY